MLIIDLIPSHVFQIFFYVLGKKQMRPVHLLQDLRRGRLLEDQPTQHVAYWIIVPLLPNSSQSQLLFP